MKRLAILLTVILLKTLSVQAQSSVRLSGIVKDASTGETIIGAYVSDTVFKKITVTDNNGYFNLSVKTSSVVRISFIGFTDSFLLPPFLTDTIVSIELTPGQELAEVVVVESRYTQSNVASLGRRELTLIPAIGGKPDIAKGLQLLPGISSQSEGSSLLLVRGGDPGQNLYHFDNVPVLYVNHLGGFMSVFNPEIINNIDVYKGGFPARYGGRLSSVVDIIQREGSNVGHKGSFGIGITDLNFSVEGPGFTKRTSYIITGRKTMIDPLMYAASRFFENEYRIMYGFHDLNAKYTWKPTAKTSLSFNFYQGDDYIVYWRNNDYFRYKEKHNNVNVWGNILTSVNLKHVATPRLYMTAAAHYSRYRIKNRTKYEFSGAEESLSIDKTQLSNVQDVGMRFSADYSLTSFWKIEAGSNVSYFNHLPSALYQGSRRNLVQSGSIESFEAVLFANNKLFILEKTELNLGLRQTNYFAKRYRDNQFEPRLTISSELFKNNRLNASYMWVHQNAHLMLTSGSIANSEIWIPATSKTPGAESQQYTVGWNSIFLKNRYSFDITLYYKTLSNLATYKEGYSNFWGDTDWQSKIESGGVGESKGVEVLLRKNSGTLTGFLSYTYSQTNRKYPNINNGKPYIYDYDRPHSLSISAIYKFNEKLSLSATWVYQTGLPYTPAIGRQIVIAPNMNGEGEHLYYEALIFGERNSARMSDYHRLDVALNLKKQSKKGRLVEWTFSVYNLYNRRNAFYYYYNDNATGEIHRPDLGNEFKPMALYKMSLFPIMPSFSYKIYFDGQNRDKRKTQPFKQRFKNWLEHK